MFALQKQLLSQNNFRNFVLSCVLAMFGNGLTYISMIWVLLQIENTVASTAMLMTAFWLPNVILGPFAGTLVDRFDRRKLLIVCNCIRGIILCLFSLLLMMHFSAVLIYILAAFSGMVLAFYVPAAISFVREVVEEPQLLAANAIIDIGYELGAVLGMGVAGLLLAVFSASGCFLINGFCYLLASVLVYFAPTTYKIKCSSHQESLKLQFIAGARYIARRRTLMLMYLLQGIFFVSYMTAPVLLAPFAKSVLHADVLHFGILEAVLSIGIVAGGLLTPWFVNKFGAQNIILWQIIVGLTGFFGFSHSVLFQWAVLFHLLIGISFSMWALLTTMAQEMTALSYQGRVQSIFNSVSGAVILIFYYMLGHMQRYRIESLYNIQIVLYVLAIFVFIFQWRARTRQQVSVDMTG